MIKALTYLYFPFGIAAIAAIALVFFGRIPRGKISSEWCFCAWVWLFMLGWRLIAGAISARYYENLLLLTVLLAVFSIYRLQQAPSRVIKAAAIGALAVVIGIAVIKNLRPPSIPAYLRELAIVLQTEYQKEPDHTVIFDETGNLKRMGYLIGMEIPGIPVPDSASYPPDLAAQKIQDALRTVFNHGDRLLYLIKPFNAEWWETNIAAFCRENSFTVTSLKSVKYRGNDVSIYEILPPPNHYAREGRFELQGCEVWSKRDFMELAPVKNIRGLNQTRITDANGTESGQLLKNWSLWSDGWGPETRIVLPDISISESAFSVKGTEEARWYFSRTLPAVPGRYQGNIRCSGTPGTRINIELRSVDRAEQMQDRILLSSYLQKPEVQCFLFEFELPSEPWPKGGFKLELKIQSAEFSVSTLDLSVEQPKSGTESR